MKNKIRCLFMLLSLIPVLLISVTLTSLAHERELRGVWVSTVYNLDFPSESGLSEAELKKEVNRIVSKVSAAGLNAVFLQVRPSSDSIYPSRIFPSSAYLTGKQGADMTFDVLDYFISAAHMQGLELHAWINPFRVTTSRFTTKEEALASLSADNPAVLHPDLVIFAGDGRLYFDPGNPEARRLIVSGAAEILGEYDVDGIQIDDYFYPNDLFDDFQTYLKYAENSESISDFRRRSVNSLIEALSGVCRFEGRVFGVSPSGIWANAQNMDGGSETVGSQSYFTSYADSKYWVEHGLLDYVAPQLYWAIGSNEGEYETLLRWWHELTQKNGITLYVGLAAYRAVDASPGSVWENGVEITDQLDMADMLGYSDGAIFFRFGSLTDCEPLLSALSERYHKVGRQADITPAFMTSGSPEIISPASGEKRVSGQPASVLFNAQPGSKVVALSGDSGVVLSRKADGYHGVLEASDKPITVICSRLGCVTLHVEQAKLISPDPEITLSRIKSGEKDGYHTVEFITGRECKASCRIDGQYLKLFVSPCRTGLLFESDDILKMVFDSKNGLGRYVFLTAEPVTECFIEDLDDRFILYFK